MTKEYLIQHLLETSAIRFPDRTAVKSGLIALSYHELDSVTNRLASTLLSHGVKRGDRVGIYVPKSLASVVAIYSILKAGGVYVPFDPLAPTDRLAFMAKDCEIKALVGCSSKMEEANSVISKGGPIETFVAIDIDEPNESRGADSEAPNFVQWNEVLAAKSSPPRSESTETDTAYILYTSGSTGVPKGVMISHRNSLAFVDWAAEEVQLNQEDAVACHAPIHFDISTFSIFSSCRAGASVIMVPEEASIFPTTLAGLIERETMSVWYSVPSVLTLLVLYGDLSSRNLSRLRAIIFAGEVFPVKYLRQLMSIVPHARYLNWYGPTETNVCTCYEVSHLDSDRTAPVPIGKACANSEVFALRPDGRRVTSTGEKGELYVRGPTLMQGYWGDPEKTSRVLLRNPLNPHFEEKTYKTGDLVTINEERDYIYLGREDGMIKTRGYRVEIGEVEAVIYAHPSVKEVAVIPVADELVGNRIHAFVSSKEGGSLSKEDLFGYCLKKLPKYMVPDTIEFLGVLPKTSSGKVDRVEMARLLSIRGMSQ